MPEGAPSPGDDPGQRSRILDAALELMSKHGSTGTSMRKLASACDLNIATLYHYFGSKAELLQAVIAERRYGDRMAGEMPPIDPALPPAERFTALFQWLWDETRAEDTILRLIVAEGLHGNTAASRSARALILSVDRWLTDLLGKTFPELEHQSAPAAARLVRGQLLGLVAEHLVTGETDSQPAAHNLATTLFPSPQPHRG